MKAEAKTEVYRSINNNPRNIQEILKGICPLEHAFGTFRVREKYAGSACIAVSGCWPQANDDPDAPLKGEEIEEQL